MPKYRVEFTEDSFNWLVSAVDQGANKVAKGEGRLAGLTDVIAQLQASLEDAVKVNERKAPPPPDMKLSVCKDHPTYGAKQAPRTDCKTCWAGYKKYHPLDYDLKRRQFKRKTEAK